MLQGLELSPGHHLAELVGWLNRTHGSAFRGLAAWTDQLVRGLETLLLAIDPLIFGAVVVLLAWRAAGRGVAVFTAAGLAFCYAGALWGATMLTLALVLISTSLSLAIALPVGILVASSRRLESAIRPLLDLMQTMPPWVYLIPAVILFGIGRAPAVLATMVFAIPPALRLTALGIRTVPAERVELGQACGGSRGQILFKIQLPSALPTIMVGVNQCIMLSLGMIVLAGLVGAGGLGGEVTQGLTRMRLGQGLRAGLAVVIVAIIIDRITQGMVGRLRRGVQPA